MSAICTAQNRYCNDCNLGKCSNRLIDNEKPVAFNVNSYRKAVAELETLREVSKALENKTISQRIDTEFLNDDLNRMKQIIKTGEAYGHILPE